MLKQGISSNKHHIPTRFPVEGITVVYVAHSYQDRYQSGLLYFGSVVQVHWDCYNAGPCITNVIATCRKNFSQWESSFLWKLRCHWLKFLRRVAKTLVIQGPGMRVFRIFLDVRIFQGIKNPEINTNYAVFSHFKQKYCKNCTMIISFRISLKSLLSCLVMVYLGKCKLIHGISIK